MKRENVRIIVLTSGEHIIGEVLSDTIIENGEVVDGVTMESPISMMPDPTPGSRGRILFIPYLQFTSLTICSFPKHNIRHVLGEVKEDLVNAYGQQFGDGLVVPQNKDLILS